MTRLGDCRVASNRDTKWCTTPSVSCGQCARHDLGGCVQAVDICISVACKACATQLLVMTDGRGSRQVESCRSALSLILCGKVAWQQAIINICESGHSIRLRLLAQCVHGRVPEQPRLNRCQ